jgi:hypothetical protein
VASGESPRFPHRTKAAAASERWLSSSLLSTRQQHSELTPAIRRTTHDAPVSTDHGQRTTDHSPQLWQKSGTKWQRFRDAPPFALQTGDRSLARPEVNRRYLARVHPVRSHGLNSRVARPKFTTPPSASRCRIGHSGCGTSRRCESRPRRGLGRNASQMWPAVRSIACIPRKSSIYIMRVFANLVNAPTSD